MNLPPPPPIDPFNESIFEAYAAKGAQRPTTTGSPATAVRQAPYAVRVTSGGEELKNILTQGYTKSLGHSGDVFVSRTGIPETGYLKYPEMSKQAKVGYAFYADPARVVDPDPLRVTTSGIKKSLLSDPEFVAGEKAWYRGQKFGVFEGGMPASELKRIQKIYADPSNQGFSLGKERDFARFQQKYEGISAASKSRSAMEMGKDLRPAARTLGNALGGFGRAVGRIAGPVGVAMTAYDLAQAFPAPAPISEEDMGEALRSYRTGPQPAY